jgi:polygalacturonase
VSGNGLIEGQGWSLWLYNSCNEPQPGQNCSTCNCHPCRPKGHCPHLDAGDPPHLVEFFGCEDSAIEGVTLRNSMQWTLHLVYSSGITVKDVKILAPVDSWNVDGLDIDSTSHVRVDGLYCYNSDDCVAVKSGLGPAGVRTRARCLAPPRQKGVLIVASMILR